MPSDEDLCRRWLRGVGTRPPLVCHELSPPSSSSYSSSSSSGAYTFCALDSDATDGAKVVAAVAVDAVRVFVDFRCKFALIIEGRLPNQYWCR